MAADPIALKTEITTDPTGLGYAPYVAAGNDTALVGLLNLPRATIRLPAGVVPSYAVVNAIVATEWQALTAQAKDYLNLVVQPPYVDLGGGEVRTALATLFGAGTGTRTKLIALVDRDASRAEQLGFGTVTEADVSRALRGA